MFKYTQLSVEKKDGLATVTLHARPESPARREGVNRHLELAEAFTELRGDDQVRVVVLTGTDGVFSVPPHSVERDAEASCEELSRRYPTEPARAWTTFTSIIRVHQVMAEMEKPIVAKVNGSAIGFGQTLVYASDLIVAVEDAVVADHHMAMGELDPVGHAFGVVPGDGAAAWAPLYMSPPVAKEYLMLSRPFTAAELAASGLINYAVPASQLDEIVADLVARLLARPARALAWTKRLANRRVVDHLNLTLDAGAAYEMANFLQLDKSGWRYDRTLG